MCNYTYISIFHIIHIHNRMYSLVEVLSLINIQGINGTDHQWRLKNKLLELPNVVKINVPLDPSGRFLVEDHTSCTSPAPNNGGDVIDNCSNNNDGPYTCSFMFSIENVVTLFSISGMVTFSTPDPKYSHVFKGCTRFHQQLGYFGGTGCCIRS